MDSRCFGTGPDVVILSDDFAGKERKSSFRVISSHPSDEDLSLGTPALRQQAQFFSSLDGLGAACGPELVEGAGTVCLDGVF
jgi:hypothetical protein